MTGNNPNLVPVNINALTKFSQILSLSSQDIEQKQNSFTNVRKMMCNNPNVDLVNINAAYAYTKNLVKCYLFVNKILT